MTSTTDRLESPSPATSIVTTGLMLFALFFGAGNLIFPPLLGAASGGSLPMVMIGFLVTDDSVVILSLLSTRQSRLTLEEALTQALESYQRRS